MDGVEVDHATWPAWQRWITGLAQLAGGVFFSSAHYQSNPRKRSPPKTSEPS